MLNYVATDATVQIVFLFVILGLVIAVGTLRSHTVSKKLDMMESNADRKWKLDKELLEFQHGAIEHKPGKKQSDRGDER